MTNKESRAIGNSPARQSRSIFLVDLVLRAHLPIHPFNMQQLQAHSVCLPPSEDYPFYVTAKRYAHPAFQAHDYSRSSNGAPPLTLLFLHSTGFHKEIYEPVLETLFGMTARGEFGIREAWAVDCPNHGESAVWNSERLLRPPHDQYCTSIHYCVFVCH